MKQIPLNNGMAALVDDDDYERLSVRKWRAYQDNGIWYAMMRKKIGGRRIEIPMHHVILGKPPEGYVTDHKDRDGLNNQRENLRHVTHRQNGQNRRKRVSRFPGVRPVNHGSDKWISGITVCGKHTHLGSFASETEAFIAYKTAVEALGETVLPEFVAALQEAV